MATHRLAWNACTVINKPEPPLQNQLFSLSSLSETMRFSTILSSVLSESTACHQVSIASTLIEN